MDDTISRQAAIDALVKRTNLTWEHLKTIYPMLNVFEKLPSAERHGRWNIELDKNRLFYECKCSVCGHIESFDPKFRFFNYCPNCGAKMDEVENK